jgi:hypothetical protein
MDNANPGKKVSQRFKTAARMMINAIAPPKQEATNMEYVSVHMGNKVGSIQSQASHRRAKQKRKNIQLHPKGSR